MLGHGGQQKRQHSSLMDKWFILKTLHGGWTLVWRFFFYKVTELANVAVVYRYLYTNLSSTRCQKIVQVILGQIILLFRVLFVSYVTLSVNIPLGTAALSYY